MSKRRNDATLSTEAEHTCGELPPDLLTYVFLLAGLNTIAGLRDKRQCSQVCRLWRQQIAHPEFWTAGRVALADFDTQQELSRFLKRFQERHPALLQLHWHGHLGGKAFGAEDPLLPPLLHSSCSRLTHLHLEDCSATAQCIAALGTSCPELRELRFRGASSTYSLERISRRAELLRVSDMLAVVKCCPKLEVLDVVSNGSNPFAPRFGYELLDMICSGLPDLRQLTLWGTLPWMELGRLADITSLQELRLFESCHMQSLPYTLPVLSHSVTKLSLEDFPYGGRQPVTLANALPQLRVIHISMLPRSQLMQQSSPHGANLTVDQLAEHMATVEADNRKELQDLSSYFSEPFGKRIDMAVETADVSQYAERIASKQPPASSAAGIGFQAWGT